MSVLTNAVRQALRAADMVTAATDVKRLVCDELARVDPGAAIESTDYFNHTYVPDVVMRWPTQPPREVFLRFMSPDTAFEDVQRIGDSGPVLLDLSNATQPERQAVTTNAAGVAISDHPSVLVTDTEATEVIRPKEAENLIERLVVSNLLRAGRGQLTERTAREASEVSRAGFAGAVNVDAEPVQAAIDLARTLLHPDLERRVERSLQLLWWAGGGDPSEFPVSLLDDMELNPTDTQDFLRMVFSDTDPIHDTDFWERLAARIDFDMLVAVGEIADSENLNRLMSPLVARLVLSHAVLDGHDRPMPPYDALSWSITDRFLRLNGPDWSCRFTPHGNRFSQRRDEGFPIALKVASRRSEGLLVDAAELEERARTVLVTRRPTEPMEYRPGSLSELALGFHPDARVRSLVVLIGEHRLTADFDRMMLASEYNSPVQLMAMVATQLLTSMTEGERSELAAFLGL